MKNRNGFHGWFTDEFRLFLQEKHTLGIKYTDEERMLYQIDAMTLNYDCQHGFPKVLVEEFIRFRSHWAKGTQESRINLIRQMALFLIKMGVPSYYPDSCWKGGSTRDFHPYIYTHEEMERLFAVADNPGRRILKRSRYFHSVIYRLLYSSGLRVSEALNLTMGDIDFVEGTIYIRNSKNHKDRKLPIDKGMLVWMEDYISNYHKTLIGKGRKTRCVPLLKNTIKLLELYIHENHLESMENLDHPLFFNCHGNKLIRQGIAYIIDKYARNIENTGKISPHQFRHSKAMHLTQADVNPVYIRDILGHVDIQTTSIYSKADLNMKRKALEKIGDTASPRVPDWTADNNLLEFLKTIGTSK